MDKQQEEALRKLHDEPGEEALWDAMLAFQGEPFYTMKQLEFSYTIRGREIFVTRKAKSKSLTESSLLMAYHKGMELMETEGMVKGPKKLGTFGASYLYSIFLIFGIIKGKP